MTFLRKPEPWTEEGICQTVDPELFYPEKGDNESFRQAKRVCAGCPVRRLCLDAALSRNEPFGIWGGKSERERRKMRGESTPAVLEHGNSANARKTACRSGHQCNEENTYVDNRGHRHCRVCDRTSAAARYLKKVAA